MKSFKILHILPESGQLSHFKGSWEEEWSVESAVPSSVSEKVNESEFDLIVDSGAVDLLQSLSEGKEKQSNRFLEGISSKAKLLVDLSGFELDNQRIWLDLDIWDQFGKQLAWRFCALDRLIWVRFANGELNRNEAILKESLQHWTGPGLFVIRADDLNSAARIALEN